MASVITDTNLLTAVRTALSKPSGDITASDMLNLTSLQASNKGIADLTGLEYATNLMDLDVSFNSITNLSPLITNLQSRSVNGYTYNLTYNDLADEEENVITLCFYGYVHHIPQNSTAVNIVDANLLSTIQTILGKVDITAKDMLSLTSLTANSSSISSLGGLEYALNLESLSLNGNDIEDITPILQLEKISSISINNNKITSWEVKEGDSLLASLDISYNHVSNVDYIINNYSHLTSLNAEQNYIRYISGTTSTIQTLNIKNNQVEDISFLSSWIENECPSTSLNLLENSFPLLSDGGWVTICQAVTALGATVTVETVSESDYTNLATITSGLTDDIKGVYKYVISNISNNKATEFNRLVRALGYISVVVSGKNESDIDTVWNMTNKNGWIYSDINKETASPLTTDYYDVPIATFRTTHIFPATSVNVDIPSTIECNKEYEISYTLYPIMATDRTCTISSDLGYTITSNGFLINEPGAGFIALSFSEFVVMKGFYATMKVTGIELSRNIITINKFRSFPILASTIPSNASDSTIIWSSTNPSIAIYDGGVIKALEEGEAVITATIITSYGLFSNACKVVVVPALIYDSFIKNIVSSGEPEYSVSIDPKLKTSITDIHTPYRGSLSSEEWTNFFNEVVHDLILLMKEVNGDYEINKVVSHCEYIYNNLLKCLIGTSEKCLYSVVEGASLYKGKDKVMDEVFIKSSNSSDSSPTSMKSSLNQISTQIKDLDTTIRKEV